MKPAGLPTNEPERAAMEFRGELSLKIFGGWGIPIKSDQERLFLLQVVAEKGWERKGRLRVLLSCSPLVYGKLCICGCSCTSLTFTQFHVDFHHQNFILRQKGIRGSFSLSALKQLFHSPSPQGHVFQPGSISGCFLSKTESCEMQENGD